METIRKLVPLYEIIQKDAFRGSFHDSFVVFPDADTGWNYLANKSKARNLNLESMPERYWTFSYLGEMPITEADFDAYLLEDFKGTFLWEQFSNCMELKPLEDNEYGHKARLKALPRLQQLKTHLEDSKDRDPEWCEKAISVIQSIVTEKSGYWWLIVGGDIEFNMQWLHRAVNEM